MYKIVSKDSEIVICYAPSVSRTRYYRQYANKLDKWMKVCQYKKIGYVQEICDELNEVWDKDFIVQEL